MIEKEITRRAALESLAAGAAYFTLPILSLDLAAKATSTQEDLILREITGIELGTIRRPHGEMSAYPFTIKLPKDALPIVSDFGSTFKSDGSSRKPNKLRRVAVEWHTGIDIMGPIGTPVIAVMDALVTNSELHPNKGNVVTLTYSGIEASADKDVPPEYLKYQKSGGLSVECWPCLDRYVTTGTQVKRGQVIGTIGSTGDGSSISFCHLEVHDEGGVANPHFYWISSPENLFVDTIGKKQTDKIVQVALYRRGKAYSPSGTRRLTYPIPSAGDMPYFLQQLGRLNKKN